MAVPTQLSDLSATAASNSPAGTDTVGTTMDDYIRAHASIIARIAAGTDKIAPAGVTGTAAILGANTFTSTQTIPDINLTSGQIAFPAAQNASAGANTLDDYEEGTWTPAITFATPGDLSVAYTTQIGTYTKIGRQVIVELTVQTSSFTHTTASGALRITGLPFAAASSAIGGGAIIRLNGVTSAGYTHFGLEATGGQTYLAGTRSGSGQVPGNITALTTPTGGIVQFNATVTYIV